MSVLRNEPLESPFRHVPKGRLRKRQHAHPDKCTAGIQGDKQLKVIVKACPREISPQQILATMHNLAADDQERVQAHGLTEQKVEIVKGSQVVQPFVLDLNDAIKIRHRSHPVVQNLDRPLVGSHKLVVPAGLVQKCNAYRVINVGCRTEERIHLHRMSMGT